MLVVVVEKVLDVLIPVVEVVALDRGEQVVVYVERIVRPVVVAWDLAQRTGTIVMVG